MILVLYVIVNVSSVGGSIRFDEFPISILYDIIAFFPPVRCVCLIAGLSADQRHCLLFKGWPIIYNIVCMRLLFIVHTPQRKIVM